MLQTSEVTTGEVARGLGDLKKAVDSLTAEVKQHPDWDDMRRLEASVLALVKAEEKMRQAERLAADKAIKALEDWNKWFLRTVGGLVLAAVGAVTLTGGVPGL